jgi:excisionase family DNA binding protein
MQNVILSTRNIDDFISDVANEVVKRIASQIENGPHPEKDRWFNLDELTQYHPNKPKKPTVYSWVNKGLIPHHKQGKKLAFLKSEIDAWLMEGKRLTQSEITDEVHSLISKRNGHGKK